MGKRIGISILVIIALAALGALAGWLTLPRYSPPAQSGEPRLRERAEQYYRAVQIKDHWTLAKLYTPARQIAEREELLDKAKSEEELFARFQEDTREQLRANMETIHAGELEVQIEGDWALTAGTVTVIHGSGEDEREVPIPIGRLVWVRSGCDWWVYQRKIPELAAYGNPPKFALSALIKENRSGREMGTIELNPTDESADAAQLQLEAEAADGDAAVEESDPPADNQGGDTSDE